MAKQPVPLMFVDSPPVYQRITILDEESTSIFVSKESSTLILEEKIEIPEKDSSIERKLKKIQTPFGLRIYQPLTFKLKDDNETSGTVEKIEGNTIFVRLDDEDKTIEIASNTIADIIWRGKSLSER